MKKIIFLGIFLIIFIVPIGCSHQDKQKEVNIGITENSSKVEKTDDIKENIITVEEENNIKTEEQKQSNVTESENIDLTEFSKTMAFAEISNIFMTPKEYIGKTVKVRGTFGYFQAYDEHSQPIPDKYHFMVVIADEMGCCGVAMEFLPGEECVFPDDFPNEEEEIIVSGIIKKEKNEYGQEDVRLTDATIERIE